jgi:predicted transcriptional regulator
MECRTQAEIDEFKAAFERGEFVDEAEESISHVRSTGQW